MTMVLDAKLSRTQRTGVWGITTNGFWGFAAPQVGR